MLELSRKIAVDLKPDADFHESWRSPVHVVLLLDNRSSTMEEPALEPVSMPHEKDGDPRARQREPGSPDGAGCHRRRRREPTLMTPTKLRHAGPEGLGGTSPRMQSHADRSASSLRFVKG